MSACFFWLSVALSRAFFTLLQTLSKESTQSINVTVEEGSWGPSGTGANSIPVATLKGVNPVLLCYMPPQQMAGVLPSLFAGG